MRNGASRWAALGLSLALLALVWVVFGQVRGFEFLNFDDPLYVAGNLHTAKGLTWANLGWALTTGAAANWHPLTWLSHMADFSMFGPDPGMHHLTSAVFHGANAVLLFLLLKSMTGDLGPSAFVAALFAAHPLHVESVAWVAERKDVLSMFFLLLTLAAYHRSCSDRRFRPAVLACYILGLMAKPMLVTLPLLLLVLDRWPLRRAAPWKDLVLEKLPLFGLAAASSLVTFLVQHSGGAVITMARLPLGYRVGNALLAYVKYLWKMVWPIDLAPLYPIIAADIRPWNSLLAGAALLALSTLAFRMRRCRPYLLAGWLWYLVSLLPVIGLIQVGSQSMADRYTYIPLLGPFLAIAWGVRDLASHLRVRPWITWASGALVTVLLMGQARVQAAYWHDSLTLFRHERAVAADNLVARNNLGQALFARGRAQEAIVEYRAAVAMDPGVRMARINLARALAWSGQNDEALAGFRRWIEVHPQDHQAMEDITYLLLTMGRLEEAIPYYQGILALEPVRLRDDPDTFRQLDKSQDARMRLGLILRTLGREAEAVPYFRAAAQLNPSSPAYGLNLAISLEASGDAPQARAWFQRVLELQPGNGEARRRLQVLQERAGGVRKPEARGSS
ncbi:MAG: tetratricopeptide repeat protein [Holophaga sp.]|nr:tetratricopeptide repeat protein [Holophaga sp.]